MKLIFACPTYGPTEPKANVAQRIAIMHAAGHGHEWLGDASPNREGWEAARNNIVQTMINDELGYPDDAAIVWCDSDVLPPPFAFTQLANLGMPFVTGIYFQRRPPYRPVFATFNGESFNWCMKWDPGIVVPIDGCGFGCVLTSLGMLRKMESPWFKFQKFSEDFDFCLKAQKAGYQLHVDTGVICGHLKDPEPATYEDFQREHPQFYPTLGGSNGSECVGVQHEGSQGNPAVSEDRNDRTGAADPSPV